MNNNVAIRILLCFLSVACACSSNTQNDESLPTRVKALELEVAALEGRLKTCEQLTASQSSFRIERKIDVLLSQMNAAATEARPHDSADTAAPVPIVAPDMPEGTKSQGDETTAIKLSQNEAGVIRRQMHTQLEVCEFQTGAVITCRVRVAPTGMVSSVETLPPHVDTPLGRCAQKVLYGMPFPATGSAYSLSHTFNF
ncbi:MAG: hypothetical protein JXX14_14580 [Deltaproteobacteria bacterium]|nr:hypothetical protein [Deltaproteobacteria bacterium]